MKKEMEEQKARLDKAALENKRLLEEDQRKERQINIKRKARQENTSD